MLTIEVISGVEGCCIAVDDNRIAGPKPWGGGHVINHWTVVDKRNIKILRDICDKYLADHNEE